MTARSDWESGIRELHAEAGGVLRLLLVTAADALALIAASAAADSEALAYLRALESFRRCIEQAADNAPLCLTCDRRLGADTPLFALVLRARKDAGRCLAVGLCAACAARHQDQAGAAAAIVGAPRMLWPDLRPIAPPSGTPGRA
jgi:hypothetical protein